MVFDGREQVERERVRGWGAVACNWKAKHMHEGVHISENLKAVNTRLKRLVVVGERERERESGF